jgi:hypothetical protein
MNVDFHSVIHCLWLGKTSNDQILSQIQETSGTDAISPRAVQRWTDDFADGKPEFDFSPRLGRPTNPENTIYVRDMIQYEPDI